MLEKAGVQPYQPEPGAPRGPVLGPDPTVAVVVAILALLTLILGAALAARCDGSASSSGRVDAPHRRGDGDVTKHA